MAKMDGRGGVARAGRMAVSDSKSGMRRGPGVRKVRSTARRDTQAGQVSGVAGTVRSVLGKNAM